MILFNIYFTFIIHNKLCLNNQRKIDLFKLLIVVAVICVYCVQRLFLGLENKGNVLMQKHEIGRLLGKEKVLKVGMMDQIK